MINRVSHFNHLMFISKFAEVFEFFDNIFVKKGMIKTLPSTAVIRLCVPRWYTMHLAADVLKITHVTPVLRVSNNESKNQQEYRIGQMPRLFKRIPSFSQA